MHACLRTRSSRRLLICRMQTRSRRTTSRGRTASPACTHACGAQWRPAHATLSSAPQAAKHDKTTQTHVPCCWLHPHTACSAAKVRARHMCCTLVTSARTNAMPQCMVGGETAIPINLLTHIHNVFEEDVLDILGAAMPSFKGNETGLHAWRMKDGVQHMYGMHLMACVKKKTQTPLCFFSQTSVD